MKIEDTKRSRTKLVRASMGHQGDAGFAAEEFGIRFPPVSFRPLPLPIPADSRPDSSRTTGMSRPLQHSTTRWWASSRPWHPGPSTAAVMRSPVS